MAPASHTLDSRAPTNTRMGAKVIGLVAPEAVDTIPAEAVVMYPGVTFISRGIGLRSLSAAGYDEAIGRVVPAAENLAARGAEAIMVIGTSLTFYRGAAFNDELSDRISSAAGLPTGTMSGAIVDGLRAVGARRLAVSTAYTAEVNELLAVFLRQKGFEVRSLQSLGAAKLVGDAARTAAQDICDLSIKAFGDAVRADAVLIVCGGLRTLDITMQIEKACGVPVVSSMPAALWAAARLVGESGYVGPGYGRLLSGTDGHPAP
jgi:arylmalonate decarboxylase